jgi:hypothetical protein
MKTTVELPAPLVKQAKRLALEEDSTLRDLIERGLQWVVTGRDTHAAGALAPPSLDEVGRGAWRTIEPDKYVASLRKDWK